MEVRHLTRAPIKEAIIDIQIEGAQVSPDVLKTEYAGYHWVNDISTMEFEVHTQGDSVSRRESHRTVGYRYESEDGKYVAQLRNEGFTFSRLTPYEDWATFAHEARTMWDSYRQLVPDLPIRRAAVRYINSLNVPFAENGAVVFSDYLRNAPQLPPDMGDEVHHFLLRLVMTPLEPKNTVAVINQTIERPDGDHLPVILDIDVYSVFPDYLPNDEQAWNMLEMFHHVKNDIFFSTMTPKALGLCQ